MLQYAWLLAPEGVTTSHRSGNHITLVLQQLHWLPTYQYDSKWNLSSLSWSIRHSITWHHCICQTIASQLPPLGAITFDHQTISSAVSLVPVHILEIKHLLLQQPFYACPSAWFVPRHLLMQTENVFNCSRQCSFCGSSSDKEVEYLLEQYL